MTIILTYGQLEILLMVAALAFLIGALWGRGSANGD